MPATAAADARLVLQYAFDDTSGTTAKDATGNGHDGVIVGGATTTGGEGLRLNGTDGYVKLPNNILAGLTSITVSTEVLIRPEQATPYFIFGLGNPATSAAGTGYLFATGNTYRAAITGGNWSGEQNVDSTANLARGTWKQLTYTLDGPSHTATLYLDGTQVGVSANVTMTPAQIGGGATTANYIGRSNYSTDKYLAGSVRDFRIYNAALSAGEVASLVPTDTQRVDRDAAAIALGTTSAVTSDLALPANGPNGSSISWSSSAPQYVSDTGSVTRPASDHGDAQVTLTATISKGSISKTRDFAVTVVAEPAVQSQIDAAAAALQITNLDDVRGNLTLPSAPAGMSTTWASSDASVIDVTGVVHRPGKDTDVTLTATVAKGSVTATRTFTAHVHAAATMDAYAGYAFAYFTGNTVAGENIYFAGSKGNNALDWKELNGGQPKLTSSFGTKGLRDPFITRSPEGDTFYLLATDLSIGGGTDWNSSQRTGSRYLEIWESHDLVHWSNQRHVLVSPETAGNTWAPEAYYDNTIGAYVVYWASMLYDPSDVNHTGNSYNRMLYATTRDFVTFSQPQVWQDPGTSRIDSTVIKVGDTYHRFTKDEGAGSTGCSDIIQEKSTDLRASLPSWTMEDSCIGKKAGTQAVEGPTAFKSNPGDVNGDKYYLFVDEYGGRGYIPLQTADINNPDWHVAPSYNLPASPRHGTVLPVTAAELAALDAGSAAPDPQPATADGQILHYDFSAGNGSTVTDTTGHGLDGTIAGAATWNSGSLNFNGTDTYIQMPNNLLSGIHDITVEADVNIDPTQPTPYFIYGLGNSVAGAGNGYLFTTGNNYRTSISTSNWTGEQTAGASSALPRGQWAHLVYTLKGTTATIYLDGVKVATQTNVTVAPGDIGGGFTSANYLGKSLYSPDHLFKGQMRDFAIYNRALSSSEVLTLSGNTTQLTDVSLANPDQLKVAPIVDTAGKVITFPVKPGTDLTKLAPTFGAAKGVTVSPASGTVQDLSKPVTYTLTQPGGNPPVTWTLKAVEMRSPVLPGYYADPNIVVFGGTYYIYATTDGFSGWGGKDFYVWSSPNLVDWTRSDKPILTLDGANGNVPWASGNAWAPTIIDRNGKYYLYFSGHNPAVNRKTIGVAVADSPTGPFVAQATPMILNNEAVKSGQAIDPATFKDPVTGKYFLFWGNGSPVYAELSDDMLSIKPGTIKAVSGLTDFREGSFVNYRKGTYYLTYSVDDTGSDNYHVAYATSSSVDGPWTYRGVILQKDPANGILATGHSSIINVPGTDDWYIAYHRFAIPGGDGTHRETTVDRLQFDSAGGILPVIPTLAGPSAETIPDPNPLQVNLSGGDHVGDTLSFTLNDPWASVSNQWTSDGKAIADATGSTFQVRPEDAGHIIGIQVRATKSLWPEQTDSAQVQIAAADSGSPTPTPSPTAVPTPNAGAVHFLDSEGHTILDGTVLRPGDRVTVRIEPAASGRGFALVLHSTPMTLASGTGTGAALTLSGTVPANAAPGAHRLIVTSDSGELTSVAVVVASADGGTATGDLASTGLAVPMPLVPIALLLLVSGIALLARRHRRSNA